MSVTVVDALGKPCPVPVIELAKIVEGLSPGVDIVLLSDDAAAHVDVPVWCRMKGHTFVGVSAAERGWAFRVRVVPRAPKP